MAKLFQVYGIGNALIPVLPPPIPFENPPTEYQNNYEIGQLVYYPPKAATDFYFYAGGGNWINITNVTSSITITGDSGGALTGNAFTFTGGATGLTFAGSGTTETLGGIVATTHGGTGLSSYSTGDVLYASATNVLSKLSASTNGFVLTLVAGIPAWQAATSSSNLTVTSVAHVASPYTVLTTDEFLACQTSGGAISTLLPNAPTTGRVIIVKDSNGAASTNNISVTTVGGTVTIDGQTTYKIAGNYGSISVVFDGSNYEVF